MTVAYEPPLGQIVRNSPWGSYGVPAYARALFLDVVDRIETVQNNIDQPEREEDYWEPQFNAAPSRLPAVTWRRWEEPDDEGRSDPTPNFEFEGVRIWWYKHYRQSISTDTDLTPLEWIDWYDRCCAYLQKKQDEDDAMG